MKIILPMQMLLVLCGVCCARKSETMSIKVCFHPDKLDRYLGFAPRCAVKLCFSGELNKDLAAPPRSQEGGGAANIY